MSEEPQNSDEPQSAADIRSAALRGLRWIVVARPMVECMLIGSMVVLARLIRPSEFGHFAVATLFSGLGVASAAAVTTALVQRPTLDREHLQAGFALSLFLGVALTVLTLVLAHFVVVPIFGARTADLVRLSSPGCLIASLGAVSCATLQRRLAFRRLSVIDVTNSATRAFSSIGLAIAGLQGGALVLGMLAGICTVTIMAWMWASPPLPRLNRGAAKDLLGYGLPAWVASVSWIGFQNCDYAIVGARLGAVQAGYYFRAYTLGVEYQKKVSQVMTTVGFPVLARARTSEDMTELRGRMVRLLTLLMFPTLVLLAIVAPVAIPWLFGHVWTPAVAPTQVLAIGGAATLVIDAVGASLMAAGRARSLLAFGWGHFATYALAVFLTAPLGLTAVATSAAVVHSGFVFVAYFLLLRGSEESVARHIWNDIAPAAGSCVALAAVAVPVSLWMSALHVPPFIDLAAVTLGAGVAYAATLRFCFTDAWMSAAGFAGHLVPRRAGRRGEASVDVLPLSATVKN